MLAPALPESPFGLRFFPGAVKTNSRGEIITGPNDDPVKNIVGAESAGERAGLERFTKILFGVDNAIPLTNDTCASGTRMSQAVGTITR